MICKNCQQDMPEESFELYPTGTRRRICRHCHYVLHMRKGRLKWVMRQRAKALISLTGGQARCEVEPHSVFACKGTTLFA